MQQAVSSLNEGKSMQEELGGETNTMVTDVMDIDRTPELLVWLFSGLWGKREEPSKEPQPLAAQQSAAAPAAGGAEAAAPHAASPATSPTTSAAASASGVVSPAVAASRVGGADPAVEPSPGASPSQDAARTEVATIGGGCFWCIEACYRELQGVVSVTSGYAGGHVANPTYKQVLTKTTGHAEVVQVKYDTAALSYRDVLQIFMSIHDATTPNRQGNDRGPQYRSIVLTHSDQQRAVADEVVAEANKGLWFGKRICTEVKPLETFYPAESYHQRYFQKNPSVPYCAMVVAPKLQEFRRKYSKLLQPAR